MTRILIITPLKPGDKVSRETKILVNRTKTNHKWIIWEGNKNPAANTADAYNDYKSKNPLPSYIIKLDNDILGGRGMIDKMYDALEKDKKASYAYCGFKFTGAINHEFPVKPFLPRELKKSNYISFNSLIRVSHLEKIGGFITDDKYYRLLDWCLWLEFLNNGMYGIPIYNTSFTAFASPNSVSARSNEDYQEKYKRVYENFIKGK
jgi:hypothetical protein